MKLYNNRDNQKALTWSKKITLIKRLGGKCSKCGKDGLFILEFHHHTGEKEFCMSRIMNKTYIKLFEELKKCILICRNCHAELHYTEASEKKVNLLNMVNKYCCEKCGYSGKSFSSLDFHHKNKKDKLFGMATVWLGKNSKKKYINKIKKELKKCMVLCKNCHMEEHIDKPYFKKITPLIEYKLKNHIQHKSPELKRISELNIKNSEYRNKLAIWLKTWRKFKSVLLASKHLGVKNNMLSNNLMQSKVYKKIRKRLSKKTSKYVGVSYVASKKKWLASIKINKKTKNLGWFNKEIDAYKKVKKIRIKLRRQ